MESRARARGGTGVAKDPLPTTRNVEGRRSCTCREEPETGPSLEASEHQHDCSGVQKIVWRENMEKIARRNIMAIYGDWRIFRRILKRDLALDRKSGRRHMTLSGRRRGQLACQLEWS